MEARWLTADNNDDTQVYLRTRAAPLTTIRVDWNINGYQEVPGKVRDHYEVEITTGTPFTDIEDVKWVSDDPMDFRLQIKSKAEGPLRWFEASWRTYFREYRLRKVIDEMAITTE
jgi:hypothetical protein